MHKITLSILFLTFIGLSSEAVCGHGQSKEEGLSKENRTLKRTFSQRPVPKKKPQPLMKSNSEAQLERKGSSRQISIYSNLPKAITSLYLDAIDTNPNWPYIKQKMKAVELQLKEIEESGSARYRDSMSNEEISNVISQLDFLRAKVKEM